MALKTELIWKSLEGLSYEALRGRLKCPLEKNLVNV